MSHTDLRIEEYVIYEFLGSCVIKICRPTLDPHVERVSADKLVDISADSRPTCRLACRRTVGRHIGRECRPTEVFITHDPTSLLTTSNPLAFCIEWFRFLVEGCTKYTWSKFRPHSPFWTQSAVYILYLVCILNPIYNLQFAICILHRPNGRRERAKCDCVISTMPAWLHNNTRSAAWGNSRWFPIYTAIIKPCQRKFYPIEQTGFTVLNLGLKP